jgi:RNA polymerase sigma-70 factor (ECF subfamily)
MQNTSDTVNPSAALKEWVALYADNLYSWALHKTTNKETAEDLVQDTFMAAVQSFEKFEGKSNPKTWLFAILNNKIVDHYRSNLKKPAINDAAFIDTFFDKVEHWRAEESPQAWQDDEHLLDNAAFQNTLSNCMKKLPESWHAALQSKYLEEKKSELICQELNISVTNYWQMLHRAKLQLRKCLELNWFKN